MHFVSKIFQATRMLSWTSSQLHSTALPLQASSPTREITSPGAFLAKDGRRSDSATTNKPSVPQSHHKLAEKCVRYKQRALVVLSLCSLTYVASVLLEPPYTFFRVLSRLLFADVAVWCSIEL